VVLELQEQVQLALACKKRSATARPETSTVSGRVSFLGADLIFSFFSAGPEKPASLAQINTITRSSDHQEPAASNLAGELFISWLVRLTTR
jgi:hypothetical protein